MVKPNRTVLGVLLLLCSLVSLRGQDPADRLSALEVRLESESKRNDAQARRIEELELTLATVLTENEDLRVQLEANDQRLGIEIRRLTEERAPAASLDRRAQDRFRLHGQGRVVVRAFGGDDISTDQSFEIEHLILYMDLEVDEGFRLRLSPGISHDGGVYVLEAFAAYEPFESHELVAGRFLVPFSGTHAWAFPSDSFIEPFLAENSPSPFLYTPWWDEGLMATGRLSYGSEGEHELFYAGYLVNGFDALGLAGIHKRTIGDNNENKTLGARASTTLRLGETTKLTLGAAGLYGKYDAEDDLGFSAFEVDVEFRTGDLSLYLEAFARDAEIVAAVLENPAASVQEVARTQGLKFRPRYRLLEGLSVFAQLDFLRVRQPERQGNRFSVFDLSDEEFAIRTGIVGLEVELTAHSRLRLEAGIFDRDRDLGKDIPFLALSLFTSF